MYDDDMTQYDDILYYDDVHIRDVLLHYNEEFSNTTLNDVIDGECVKVYAFMLGRVICE